MHLSRPPNPGQWICSEGQGRRDVTSDRVIFTDVSCSRVTADTGYLFMVKLRLILLLLILLSVKVTVRF